MHIHSYWQKLCRVVAVDRTDLLCLCWRQEVQGCSVRPVIAQSAPKTTTPICPASTLMHHDKRLDRNYFFISRSQWALRTLRLRFIAAWGPAIDCGEQQWLWRRLLPTSPLRVSPCDLRAEEGLSLPGRFTTRRGNMGGTGSRRVSFGLDEDEKVTVIEGVKVDLYPRVSPAVKFDLA